MEAFIKMKDAVSDILLPITMGIDAWSDLLKILFTTSIWARVLVWSFEHLVDVFVYLGNMVKMLLADLSGFMSVASGSMLQDDKHSSWNPVVLFKAAVDDFKEGQELFLKDHPLKTQADGTPSPNTKIDNHNHIEARFDFKEQLEPDRVAFAVTEHLKKLVINATQGRGQSLSGGYNNVVAGSN